MEDGEEGFGAKYDDFRFIAIQFEGSVDHPGFYISEAVGEDGENGGSNGFERDIQLYFICVVMLM